MKVGRELDALIAETVMGWRKLSCGECGNRPWLPKQIPCSYWHDQAGKDVAPISDIYGAGMSDGLQERAWSPSTDIKAAMQVVEHRFKFGKESFTLQSPHEQTRKWWACFERKWPGKELGHGVDEHYTWTSAETAPLAICLAALKAVDALLKP